MWELIGDRNRDYCLGVHVMLYLNFYVLQLHLVTRTCNNTFTRNDRTLMSWFWEVYYSCSGFLLRRSVCIAMTMNESINTYLSDDPTHFKVLRSLR